MDISESPFTDGNLKLLTFVRECHEANLAEVDSSTVEVWLNELLETNGYSRSADDCDKTLSELIQKVHDDFNAQLHGLLAKEQFDKYRLS